MADFMTMNEANYIQLGNATAANTPESAADICRQIALFLRTNPAAWCKGVVARRGDGSPLTGSNDPHARSWCAMGLVSRFTQNEPVFNRVVERLSRVITPPNSVPIRVELYNDQEATTLQDVIAMFECAALLPRAFDEVAPTTKPLDFSASVPAGAFYSKALQEAFGTLGALNKIETPPPEPKIEIAKSALLTEAALEHSMQEIVASQKKLVPWSKIMAQLKGEAVT